MAKDSIIGNSLDNDKNAFQIYNQLNVTGSYNVGGIAGTIEEGTTVTNAANFGTILAKGYIAEEYLYHSAITDASMLPEGSSFADRNNGIVKIKVNVANSGGIVGYSSGTNTEISDVVNSGDIATATKNGAGNIGEYYIAGNIGGIVGSAKDTNIKNAENKENNIAGAHNVGGVAGYITGTTLVDLGVNNGGDIVATGARKENDSGFAQEAIRQNGSEVFNVGNIGGVVGYLYGDNVRITNSANRGTVHSAVISENYIQNPLEISKAANVGGIVGKLDRAQTQSLQDILNNNVINIDNVTISNSYNTGNVQGYTGVGGIVGLMYNGSVTGSYNIGTLTSTRQPGRGASDQTALNMGGIVGDTTEGTSARALIYDVYNKGIIGDSTFNFSGRHIGGIVGRLSGTVEKAYNNGDIYNGYNVVGGIVGYWYTGEVNNTFNTGNITVNNKNSASSQVGGIVGAVDVSSGDLTLSNSYNLGVLRSFKDNNDSHSYNTLGGIVGEIENWGKTQNTLTVRNVYTLGTLYVDGGNISPIVGYDRDYNGTIGNYKLENAYYIQPEVISPNGFKDLSTPSDFNANHKYGVIAFADRYDSSKYKFTFKEQNDIANQQGAIDGWRIYENTTPILNAFIPDMAQNQNSWEGYAAGATIQYGTAYNPLLTILKDPTSAITLDWSVLGISGSGSLAVFGDSADLTINNFSSLDGRYYGGIIYADGALTINASESGNSQFNFGAASELYGSSVSINAESANSISSDITIYGTIASTSGDISLTGKNINVYGQLISSIEGESITIAGINSKPNPLNSDGLIDPSQQMQSITDRFSYSKEAEKTGNIILKASEEAQVLYGHLGHGKVVVGADGQFTVSGAESVYVDSDLSGVKGNISLSSTNGEVLLDITNIANAHTSNSDPTGKETLHNFLKNFALGNKTISLSGKNNDEKIAIDMWSSDGTGFDLKKYDLDNKTLVESLNNLNVSSNNQTVDLVHIWINSAEQLDGIQRYYILYKDSGTGILGYNFALKDNIDASVLTEYEAIGAGAATGFTGTFDGRNYRIVGLSVGDKYEVGMVDPNLTPSSSGIFSSVGKDGTVENLRVYGSSFYGMDYAGAIAGKNEGIISNITTLGNHVEVFGSDKSAELDRRDPTTSAIYQAHVGAAGGIVGLNKGTISDITVSDSIIAGSSGEGILAGNILATAGGISGINEGSISNVTADSAITANEADTYSLGGIAGYNSQNGKIDNAFNTGVTHGEYGDGNITSNSVGGIVGVNVGNVRNVFNSSDVTGGDYVGGVVGYNSVFGEVAETGKISNAVNAGDIFSEIGRLSLLGAIPVVGGILGGITADAATKSMSKNSTANKIKEGFYQYFANIFLCNVGACAALFTAEGLQKAGIIKPLSAVKKMAVILTGITATGIIGGSWIANKLSQKLIDPLFGKSRKNSHRKVYEERKPELADIALHADDIATAGVLSGFKWIEPALPLMYFVSGYRAGIGYRNNCTDTKYKNPIHNEEHQ